MEKYGGNIIAHLVMFGWIPAVLVLFSLLPPRRAVITAFVAGWLFLPMTSYQIEGMPNYSKFTAPAVAILVAAIIFDPGRVASFRPRIWDLPMLVWCLVPFASSVSNDLGAYDGLSGVANQTILWGLPYFIGRLYFTDPRAMKELAVGVLIGGLIYLPLCLWEIKMSPQLHRLLYGYHQHNFEQSIRGSTYRPMVFLQHGLAVGMYMTAATLMAAAFWVFGTVRQIRGVPIWAIFGVMFLVTGLCKSAFATVLLLVGCGVLAMMRWVPSRVWIASLILVPALYMSTRTIGGWSAQDLIDAAGVFGESRALSLATRVRSENILWEHASERPIFGWAGWSRALVFESPGGKQLAVPDGMWIIAVGQNGLVGLASLTAALLMGPALILRRFRPADMRHPAMGAVTVTAVLLTLHMCDNLLNAMVNPIFLLGLGGLVAIGAKRWARPAAARLARPGRTVGGERPRPTVGPVAEAGAW